MKNKELILVKNAIYGMEFRKYGVIKEVEAVVNKLDAAAQDVSVKHNAIFDKYQIPFVGDQRAVDMKHESFSAIQAELSELYEEEIEIDVAFLTEEEFDRAISVGGISTESLLAASKYLVK